MYEGGTGGFAQLTTNGGNTMLVLVGYWDLMCHLPTQGSRVVGVHSPFQLHVDVMFGTVEEPASLNICPSGHL